MTYEESVRFLYSLGNELKAAKYELGAMRVLLGALGDPHRKGRFIHVAGTNGKGSTCAMIEAGLRAAGYRTGLYTSPHLAEPTERIRISGEEISREEFASLFATVHRCAEELIARGELAFHPSYFETVTAMAFLAMEGCDRVVLEVGLGGRLDATNVVQPELSVITPVDFDHEAWLGHTIELIAFEKAGILKPGAPAVMAAQRPEAEAVIRARAGELGVTLLDARDWQVQRAESDRWGSRFELLHGGSRMTLRCGLAGEHQIENARTAAIALQASGVPREAIESGIAGARWPGRLERVRLEPEIILDGAHNPAGARALAAYVDRFYPGEPLTLIYGAMRDKAVEEVAGILFPRFAEVIVTAPQQARALAPESLLELVDHRNIRVAKDLRSAAGEIRGTTFITGSLFLVAEARALLIAGRA